MITRRPRRNLNLLAAVAALAAACVAFTPNGHVEHELAPGATAATHAGHPMSDAQMRAEVEAWFAKHPAHGARATAAAVDTFTVTNFRFDTDRNAATQVDTARILVGETIMWKWAAGFHTATSGRPGDLNAGSRFDFPIDNLNPTHLEASVAFDTAGLYPFFCRPHGQFSNMVGFVRVQPNPVGVPPSASDRRVHGFVGSPYPDPMTESTRFRFALASVARARVIVSDVAGRRVAVPIDADLGVGPWEGVWNGRGADGTRARPGVYYLRFEAGGRTDVRRVVLAR